MTWTQLLASRDVQRHETSKRELDEMRGLIARDLADAQVQGVSADRRFATAYNAALQSATMAIACAGYRVTAKAGHHKVTVDAITLALSAPPWARMVRAAGSTEIAFIAERSIMRPPSVTARPATL